MCERGKTKREKGKSEREMGEDRGKRILSLKIRYIYMFISVHDFVSNEFWILSEF